MVCDLGFCTPASRRIAAAVCEGGGRPGVRFFAVKFSMVVVMTVAMTVFGALMAAGLSLGALTAACLMFPFNFTIALPVQMLVVAPISGRVVNAVGWGASTAAEAA